MTKNEYAKNHGLKVRKPTKEERAHATKNGATAHYVIDTPSGHSYWSQSGTMDDLRRANNASKAAVKKHTQPAEPKQTAKATAKPVAKTTAKTASKAKSSGKKTAAKRK